jgi:hypothetical protein
MRPLLAAGFLTLLMTSPIPAAPDKTRPAPADGAAEIADKLLERADFDRFEQVTVRTILDVLQEKLGYTILVDHKAILAAQGQDGSNPQVLEGQQLTLPAMKKVRIETALRQVLDQIGADFFIEADHIRVTTGANKDLVVGPRRVLPSLRPVEEYSDEPQPELAIQIRHTPTVTAAFQDVPLAEAVRTVSLRTGRAIAINPDAGDKAKSLVSVALANAPFDTAVATLAEAAGLRAFRVGNAAVLVGPERARQIERAARLSSGPDVGGESRLATPDGLDRLRQDRARREAERQALEEKVQALTAELERLKKK